MELLHPREPVCKLLFCYVPNFDIVYLKVFEIIHYNTEEDFRQGGEFGPAVVYGEEARLQHRLINKLFWGTLIQTIAAASYFLEAVTTT